MNRFNLGGGTTNTLIATCTVKLSAVLFVLLSFSLPPLLLPNFMILSLYLLMYHVTPASTQA